MSDWLKSLKTPTPQKGYELAIKLAREGVVYTQPSAEVRKSCGKSMRGMRIASSWCRRLLRFIFKRWQLQITIGSKQKE